MAPLICTANSAGHVDYGIPLTANHSTDYRTCTGTYHRFIPFSAHSYDTRIKAKFKPELLKQDIAIRNETYKTYYNENYTQKMSGQTPMEKCFKAPRKVDYIRNVEEKIFKDPPQPMHSKISEMKDAFRMNHITPEYRRIYPPAITAKCKIEGMGRDEQPTIRPEEKGYWKWLDIYLTENKSQYVPYTTTQMEDVAKDLVTYYNATGKYKGLQGELQGPGGNKAIFDKVKFKRQYPNKKLSNAPKRVPNFGMQSEYQGKFRMQSYSDFYPYLSETGVSLDDSLPAAGAWQNLCAPGMYCTEYCHIGTRWPVRAIVNPGLMNEHPGDDIVCEKYTDNS